ncbi:MAG: hypothetical protein LW855_05605 [Alphaproteobacteria bacterium]|jgi:hypothetical protein|nr:hypothetical protein [Thalassospira sp.]MCE2965251.1 hypothetical protein [Alphaproteobacteria bacterium]
MAKKRKPPAAPSAPKKQTRTERGAAAIDALCALARQYSIKETPESLKAMIEEGRR